MQNREITVSLLGKSRKNYISNLNEKDIFLTSFFWKTVKPSLADNVILRDKINLSEKNQIIKSELKKVDTLNNIFSNIKNLKKSI